MHLHLAFDQLDGGEQERGEGATDGAAEDECVEWKLVGDEIWIKVFTDERLGDVVLFMSTRAQTMSSGMQGLVR